mmetsp:Transcript_46408/g.105287  ORF Transcript_46408/g.105287 Transcript_46408/m.105287 type:complete len:635 (+) Transcript_46408:56-1960(+)
MRVAWLLAGWCSAQSDNSSTTETAAQVLQKWYDQLEKNMKAPPKGDACVNAEGQTGMEQDCSEGCSIQIQQDTQRFGQFRQVIAAGGGPQTLAALGSALDAERVELVQKRRQLTRMLAFLRGEGNDKFSAEEVSDQVSRGRQCLEGVTSRIEITVSKDGHACVYSSIEKPAMMFANPTLAEENPRDASGASLAIPANLSAVLELESSISKKAFTLANNRYAAAHKLVSYVWMYFPGSFMTMTPYSGSGPEMPEASSTFCFVEFMPWCGMFGPDVSCASPLMMVLANNPAASSWLDCSEFGLLTFSPGNLGESSCWMLPFVGQQAQLIPGRQLPHRTCFGSHPCASSCNMDGAPDFTTQQHITKDGTGYDAELVALLYGLAGQNVSFSSVSYFTTSLSQLALLGVYPEDAALQHHGVQFVLPAEAQSISNGTGRVLTVEMMVEGLLWTLREQPLAEDEVYSLETYHMEHLDAGVVADFVVDQKGATYKDANCQAYARHLLTRVLSHGTRSGQAVELFVASQAPLSRRALVLLAGVSTALLGAALAQLLLLARFVKHCRAAQDTGRIRGGVAGLVGDAEAVDQWAAKVGGRWAPTALRAVVAWLCPVFLWYLAGRWVVGKLRGEKVAPALEQPLLK